MSNLLHLKSFGSIDKKRVQTTPTIKEKCTFTWVIKNFRNYSTRVGCLKESPHFFTGTNEECEWSVDIYPDGYDQQTCDYVGIRAVLFYEHGHENTNFAFKCSVLDEDLLNKAKLLPNGELRIACEILDLSETCAGREVQCSQNMQIEICKALFDTKKFSDFKLVVQEKEFCVHRAILSARSPVFEAMFESNMRETREGEAHIDDIEPEVMEEAHIDDIEAKVMEKLLRFIYTGDVAFENLIDKVLVAADKYQLDILKSHCESVLAKALSVDNVYDVLLLADRVNATDLKARAMEFFDDNKKKLVTAHDFKSLIGSFPKELLIDIISANALKH